MNLNVPSKCKQEYYPPSRSLAFTNVSPTAACFSSFLSHWWLISPGTSWPKFWNEKSGCQFSFPFNSASIPFPSEPFKQGWHSGMSHLTCLNSCSSITFVALCLWGCYRSWLRKLMMRNKWEERREQSRREKVKSLEEINCVKVTEPLPKVMFLQICIFWSCLFFPPKTKSYIKWYFKRSTSYMLCFDTKHTRTV